VSHLATSLRSLVAVALLVAAAACGSSSGSSKTRPTTTARLAILAPTTGQVVAGSTTMLRMQVLGGEVVKVQSPPDHPLPGNKGHIHVFLDSKLVSMAYGTTQQLTGLTPGSHSILAEFVATDHKPFANDVAVSVTFVVKAA
jgi:hypothetical protein